MPDRAVVPGHQSAGYYGPHVWELSRWRDCLVIALLNGWVVL